MSPIMTLKNALERRLLSNRISQDTKKVPVLPELDALLSLRFINTRGVSAGGKVESRIKKAKDNLRRRKQNAQIYM